MWVAPSFTSASIQIHAAQCPWHLCWAIFVWSCVQSCGVDLMLNPHVHWLKWTSHMSIASSPQYRYPLVNVYIAMENHYFQWVNPLFLWQFSIAMLVPNIVIWIPHSADRSPWVSHLHCILRRYNTEPNQSLPAKGWSTVKRALKIQPVFPSTRCFIGFPWFPYRRSESINWV